MAGMDWFRWHHGSVTDPKFQLVAKKSGTSVADVVALWAFALEEASLADDRGSILGFDVESVECLLGLDDGKGTLILEAMEVRGLIADGRIAAWDKRQPSREREDDTASERKRKQRERESMSRQELPTATNVTPSHAMSHQETPREEKSREDKKEESKATRAARFDFFKSLTDEGVSDQAAKDYIATRKAKRCAQTETAFKQFIVEVRRSGISTAEIVDICCKKSWGGFESAWLDRDRLPQARGSPIPTTGRQSRIDNYAAQAAAARGEHENEYGNARTERDITSEAVRVA